MFSVLVLYTLLYSVSAQADKASVTRWTRLVQMAASKYVNNIRDSSVLYSEIDKFKDQIPTAGYYWLHMKEEDNIGPWKCGNIGTIDKLAWTIIFMCQTYDVKKIEAGPSDPKYLATWKMTSGDDNMIRKCGIRAEFENGKLATYYLVYDHTSPLV